MTTTNTQTTKLDSKSRLRRAKPSRALRPVSCGNA
jgi:hypothetical protein